MLKTIIKSVAVTAGIAVTLSSGAFAQTYISDTTFAKVPFRVNVDATITAVQGDDTISKAVTGKTTGADTLKIPLEITITTAVRDAGKVQGRLNAPTITGTRGNITLRLPAQSYSNAEVALHSVNGKRILRGKADAKDAVSGISRRNIAAGVYLLSVKGNNGTFTTRLTHSGGKMNINVAFGTENALRSPARNLGKKAEIEEGDWEITVSAESHKDSSYILKNLVAGNNTLQVITLLRIYETFTDERDGTIYKKILIGTQTWMAENLKYDVPENTTDICYIDGYGNDVYCARLGRFYDWTTAMDIDKTYQYFDYPEWDGSDVNHQGICPAGWHLPSDAEWTQLTDFVGGAETAGKKLKSTKGWSNDRCSNGPNGNGTDEYGFSASPNDYVNGCPDGGESGYWWSASRGGYRQYYYRTMWYRNDKVERFIQYPSRTYAVRCVEDVE
jgi:uncharacterized protein (TIGR02145 family)